jgi:MFS transporter, DHA1 family, inner membrane transport protein
VDIFDRLSTQKLIERPMAYFRNNAVNLLNLHYGIHALALTGGGAFYAVFLLKSAVPAPAVLTSFAAILLGRFAIRPVVLPLARHFGLKPLLIFGTVATGMQYPLLADIHGVGRALFVLCAVSALADTFYWTSYHAYFASLGDPRHRGHEVSAREAVAAMVGIIGPLATGWALTMLGPHITFDATAGVLTLAALPIFFVPAVTVPAAAPGALRAAIPGVLLFAADGWLAAGLVFVWQIALFLALGEDFSAFGGAMALAAVVGAASGLVLGRLVDAGHGARAAGIAFAALALTTLMRGASYDNAALAVIANAGGALVSCLYTPTLGTAVYNQARQSPCALRFHIAAEGGWDLGGAGGNLAAAGLLAAGAPLGLAILFSLPGSIAAFVLLRRYFKQFPASRPAAGPAEPITPPTPFHL